MRCGLCEGNHLTIRCPRLSQHESKQAASVDKQANQQPKATFPESQPVTHALLTPVTHDTGQSVTHAVTHASANAARQARWRASHKAEKPGTEQIRANQQPKALPTDSDRKHIPANTLNTAANSEPVNTNKDESVNTAANKDEPVNCLQCAALRQRIAELEARLAPKPRMGRAAYMRDYMRQYRARKVPG